MTTPTIQSLDEICSDCNMDKSVHARYGKCPVYVVRPMDGVGIFHDDRTQAQRHEQDHARIYVPGCGYCRERALIVNGPGTKVRDDNASAAPEDGGHENINSH